MEGASMELAFFLSLQPRCFPHLIWGLRVIKHCREGMKPSTSCEGAEAEERSQGEAIGSYCNLCLSVAFKLPLGYKTWVVF